MQSEAKHWTFITPFIVTSFVSLPNVIVLAVSKQILGHEMIKNGGGSFSDIVTVLLWVLVPLTVLFAVLHLWRGRGLASKAAVIILTVAVVVAFAYAVWPDAS